MKYIKRHKIFENNTDDIRNLKFDDIVVVSVKEKDIQDFFRFILITFTEKIDSDIDWDFSELPIKYFSRYIETLYYRAYVNESYFLLYITDDDEIFEELQDMIQKQVRESDFVEEIVEKHAHLIPVLKLYNKYVNDEMKEKYDYLFKNDLF